ncbi:hypothetical protein P170DRAFT_441423 [Aspergillus steynii IBT 23096]|uniref:Uncharacterized protein n=1 Tax=Aspergillus steynii IBT 23096 TaxID=1392250 RepID=A0A2I2FTP1_9EURO|nr:uncharacterized protein P170DRAFT_441423 [Aspergillus steynii IBT 23096]PLB43986.1 hypothetical protein P170DRAFT_441423 [Aspergillus steynii IBT 23096]
MPAVEKPSPEWPIPQASYQTQDEARLPTPTSNPLRTSIPSAVKSNSHGCLPQPLVSEIPHRDKADQKPQIVARVDRMALDIHMSSQGLSRRESRDEEPSCLLLKPCACLGWSGKDDGNNGEFETDFASEGHDPDRRYGCGIQTILDGVVLFGLAGQEVPSALDATCRLG